MAKWALIFALAYLVLAFGLRTVVHLIRTGSTGFKGISGRPGSPEWLGGALFAVAVVCALAAPILDLAGVLGPISPLNGEYGNAAGGGLFFGGLAITLVSQAAMGGSWRIGVDQSERTELVTDGPFAAMRNPVFTGMLFVGLGLTLLVPSAVAILGFVALVVGLELQVRAVEEPYLLKTHGRAYAGYAARTGRFFPLVGRLAREPSGTRARIPRA